MKDCLEHLPRSFSTRSRPKAFARSCRVLEFGSGLNNGQKMRQERRVRDEEIATVPPRKSFE